MRCKSFLTFLIIIHQFVNGIYFIFPTTINVYFIYHGRNETVFIITLPLLFYVFQTRHDT